MIHFTCDMCGKTFTDRMEIAEFHHINLKGGYNSVFGDMGLDSGCVKCDLCQYCLHGLIKTFCRTEYGADKKGLDPLYLNNLGTSWFGNDSQDPPTECRINPYDAVEWFDAETEILRQPKKFKLNPEGLPAIGVLFGTTPLILDPEIESGFVLLRYKEGTKRIHFDADPCEVKSPDAIIRALLADNTEDNDA